VGRFVELSHALEDGMAVFPGLPRPRIGAFLDHQSSRPHYKGLAEFYLGRVEMPTNIGTYLDSPFHRFERAPDLSQVPLDRLAGVPGIVIDATSTTGRSIDVSLVQDVRGRAVLIATDWDRRWRTPSYWEPCPFLAPTSVEQLVRAGAALVGIDTWNVDDTEDPARQAHTRLLDAGILIVEHLCNLRALPRDGFRFFAAPPRIVRGASFPVRAFAEIITG
jgi:arylformamidase